MKQILIVEDDPAIRRGLKASLEGEHFQVTEAADGEQGYQLARGKDIDLIILDWMLPGRNGDQICRDLRAEGIATPIIMLTSKTGEMDKVLGLEVGADDYVTKPFSTRELLARIRAVLRRQSGATIPADTCRFGGVHVDFVKHEVTKAGKPVRLSAKQLAGLRYLVEHEGMVISRNMLLNAEMKLRAALFRTESRGTHCREDFPLRDDPEWLCWVTLEKGDGRMVPGKRPIPREWWPDLSAPYEERYPFRLPGEGEAGPPDGGGAEVIRPVGRRDGD